jgi:cellulose synthase/poly-beta-1,6-N-acetylglucosamine synthase-like glycosyltransferase
MVPNFLFELDHDVFVLALVLCCLLGSSHLWILDRYFRYRRQGLAEEARLLDLPLPRDADLPHVLVQLPSFNEGALICRVADAVANLDWPNDRLHVQVLDDSTDGSVAQSEKAVAELRGRGIDAVLMHRTNRLGFKAGALADGMFRSEHAFVAMFDADYLPPRDFLRRCMRPLLHDHDLALVQGRCDYLNGGENFLTYAQQRFLDAHFAVEQAARSWGGQVLPFNGTCGIWRRAAIDDAGGWQGDTLCEDLDLSYRVQLRGWRALFLTTITVPGELPRTFGGWRRQQFRWTKGFGEVTKKMAAPVWRSGLTLGQKLVSSLHLGAALLGPLSILTIITGVIDLTQGVGLTVTTSALIALQVVEMNIAPAALMVAGQFIARDARLASELFRLPAVIGLQIFVGVANLTAGLEAFLGRASAFVRTPKDGALASP